MWSIDTLLDCDLVVFQYRSTRDQIPSIYIVLANQLSKYSALCVDVHFVVAVFDAENVDCHLSCNKKKYRHLKMCAHEIVYTKKGQFFFPISIAFFHKKKMTWANICYHSKKIRAPLKRKHNNNRIDKRALERKKLTHQNRLVNEKCK